MTDQELLAVLDMSEDEQFRWLMDNDIVTNEYVKCSRHLILADLGFRLRDEAMNFNKGAWRDATEQIWRECHDYREYRNFWVDRSKPIHWILASLIAKGKANEDMS